MTTPNNAAALERLDKLIQGLAEQQAMPDDAWRIEYAEIRKTLAKMQGGGRADDLALEVARRFTLDTEPQRRASMQCAVADAIKRSGLPPTDDSEGWDGEPSYQDLIDYVTAPTNATQPDALTSQPSGEAVDREEVLRDYVADYEFLGETEDVRDACYQPNERERLLIEDAIRGWIAFDLPSDPPSADAPGVAVDEELPNGHRWLDPEIDMLTKEEADRLRR